ncbi:hypothetical protein AVEN_84497-1 [Araneus ventricosus]|uniref:Uncharacterized protein n=1 Tax=Araneus ventricosus TaxID=182803 RepID=A0A4Y2QEE7_ARAVE|nr:hypothetical protein AVEN_266270-1 [Araneus ventricosus]GBN61989.1 hypothetical protein AVEN_32203-1 [Araneus ventricosus]GBN61994.1 hypothetical protein AVEN_60918-1 [Araneus ventricosus]GBN62004.1 hypothetical protein AVEN_84497-1 [Araneus ventricosus]
MHLARPGDIKIRSHPPLSSRTKHIGRAWWMPVKIARSAKTTTTLTGLTPDATSARKSNPKALTPEARHVGTIVCLYSSLSWSSRVSSELWPQKSEDLHHGTPAGRAIHSLISSATERVGRE